MGSVARQLVAFFAARGDLVGPVLAVAPQSAGPHGDTGWLAKLCPGRCSTIHAMPQGPITEAGHSRLERIAHAVAARTILCLHGLDEAESAESVLDALVASLAPDGLIVVTAAVRYGFEKRPWVKQPLSPLSIARALGPLDASVVGWEGAEDCPRAALGIGWRAESNATCVAQPEQIARELNGLLTRGRMFAPIGRVIRRLTAPRWTRLADRSLRPWRFAVHAPAPSRLADSSASSRPRHGSRLDLI